ncbi:MAG: hypothetical protein HZB51_26035 [Chloroflexi bacterium]|nr:hypothetical protein [Chloroflexota bacterium]
MGKKQKIFIFTMVSALVLILIVSAFLIGQMTAPSNVTLFQGSTTTAQVALPLSNDQTSPSNSTLPLANGMTSDACPMMNGMGMTGMTGMTGMNGMGTQNMSGMMGMSGMSGGQMMGVDAFSYATANPWWLLGWLVLFLILVGLIAGLVASGFWLARRTKPNQGIS